MLLKLNIVRPKPNSVKLYIVKIQIFLKINVRHVIALNIKNKTY